MGGIFSSDICWSIGAFDRLADRQIVGVSGLAGRLLRYSVGARRLAGGSTDWHVLIRAEIVDALQRASEHLALYHSSLEIVEQNSKERMKKSINLLTKDRGNVPGKNSQHKRTW